MYTFYDLPWSNLPPIKLLTFITQHSIHSSRFTLQLNNMYECKTVNIKSYYRDRPETSHTVGVKKGLFPSIPLLSVSNGNGCSVPFQRKRTDVPFLSFSFASAKQARDVHVQGYSKIYMHKQKKALKLAAYGTAEWQHAVTPPVMYVRESASGNVRWSTAGPRNGNAELRKSALVL